MTISIPADPEHAGWFRDVRAVLDFAETATGLPLPFISSDRATFHLTVIKDPAEASAAVNAAVDLLSTALGLTFASRLERGGHARYCILEATMPSGLVVMIMAYAKHVDPATYARGRLTVIHGAASEMHAASYAAATA